MERGSIRSVMRSCWEMSASPLTVPATDSVVVAAPSSSPAGRPSPEELSLDRRKTSSERTGIKKIVCCRGSSSDSVAQEVDR